MVPVVEVVSSASSKRTGKRDAKRRERTSDAGVKAPKPKPRRDVQRPPAILRSGAKNQYLECILDPRHGPVVGVPDTVTMRSIKFRTVNTTQLVTGGLASTSAFAYAIAPAITGGACAPSATITGSQLAMVTGAAAAPVATFNQAAVANACVNAADRASILANYSMIRPVAMEVAVKPTGPALTLQGVHSLALVAGSEWPFKPDTAVSAVGGIATIGQIANIQTTSVGSVDDAHDASDVFANIQQPLRGIWSPADSGDIAYCPVNAMVTASSSQWSLLQIANTSPAETDTYVAPGYMTTVAAGAYFNQTTNLTEAGLALPYFRYVASGLNPAANTAFAEMEISVVWEAIPNTLIGVGMSAASLSPSNPDEMTQAINVMEVVPACSTPRDPTDTAAGIQEAAKMAASHLYDSRVPKKDALEGSSILKTLAKGALSVGSAAVSAVPGFGQVASAGLAMLSSLL